MATISLLGGLLPIVVIATLVFLYRKPIKVTLMIVMMNLTMMMGIKVMMMEMLLVDQSNFPAWFHPSRASQSHNNSLMIMIMTLMMILMMINGLMM